MMQLRVLAAGTARRAFAARACSGAARYGAVPAGPVDPIFGVQDVFDADPALDKVILGVGAFRTDAGEPYVLPVVREAERRILDAHMDHEYTNIGGIERYVDLSLELLYGAERPALREGRVAGIQTVSGTGALRMAGEFLTRFFPTSEIYLSSPTWGNHPPIFTSAGCSLQRYRYLDPETNGLDFEGMCADLKAAKPGSAIVLHACAHNPTGVDPTLEQWAALVDVFRERDLIPIFDTAYQGFATGDAAADAAAVRLFVDSDMPVIACQSYSKNFGLYGERVGALSVVTTSPEEADRVTSQLRRVARPMYSNPPIYGARIVQTVLDDPVLNPQWYEECRGMAMRIKSARDMLYAELQKSGSSLNWQHVVDQIGMFCFTGLSPDEVRALGTEHHIYTTLDGRISMAGVCTSNVAHLGDAIHKVTSSRPLP